MTSDDKFLRALTGVLLGTAVGDSLGLPAEGLSRDRIRRRWNGEWRQRFIFGRGMVSDDTEHTIFIAQALLAHPDDAMAFQRCLAWKLRFWLLGLPAGVGLATLKAIIKLWLGFSPARSGVRSAGNGPAMRSAIIGAYFADDAGKRRDFVAAATRLTHADPRAETAALAVAEYAAWAVNQNGTIGEWLLNLPELGRDAEWQDFCGKLNRANQSNLPVSDFAEKLGQGKSVTGYAYHSVPVVLYAAVRHGGNFREAMEAVLNCGGDTDTTGAIVGALVAAQAGKGGIPKEWLDGVWEWPRSISLLERIAVRLNEQKLAQKISGPVAYFWPGLVLRNMLFLITVLAHGFRRLAPPY